MLVGVLLALATSVSWAFGNVFIQKSGRAVGSARAMIWALAAGGLLSGALSLALDEPRALVTASFLGWTALAGVTGLLAYVCLFYAFERSPLSIAVPLVSSWSIVSGAFSLAVLGERPGPRQLVGAALVIAGVILVSLAGSRGPQGAGGRGKAILAGFGAALGFGIMVPVMTARVAPAVGAFGATAVVYAIGGLLALPLAVALRAPLGPPAPRLWPLVLLTGCFETFGFVAVSFAQRFAPNTVVTPVASLAAALTVLYAWVVLRERPDRLAMAGAGLASVGIVVLSG